ncbi:hypothetical protein EV360DRAFT_81323 [Lentinula raphanica]|nr:hypothetical protein EV360DRAFT_81323 [Lentinula raphanica]
MPSINPRELSNYYASLAHSYKELTLYHEAEEISTRALQLNPTSHKARFNRAMVRVELDDLPGAVADIDALFEVKGGEKFHGARRNREMLHELFRTRYGSESTPIVFGDMKKLSWPQPELPAIEPSPEDHCPRVEIAPGQYRYGLACWGHNIKKKGCRREDCIHSHTPDYNSIRDTKGRNVCLYFLVGHCSRNGNCTYAHSTDGMPEDITTKPSLDSVFTLRAQWWNDSARMKEVHELLKQRSARRRARYEIGPHKAMFDQAAQGPPEALAGALETVSSEEEENVQLTKTAMQAQDLGVESKQRHTPKEKLETTGKKNPHIGKEVTTPNSSRVPVTPSNDEEKEKKEKKRKARKTVKIFERLTNCGLTDEDVVDLIEFGVNPWDEDAHSVFAYVDDY